jgi:hypothetical protein
MPVENLTDSRAGYSRAANLGDINPVSGRHLRVRQASLPGERKSSVTLAAAPLNRDQRNEAQQRSEHKVIARRQAIAGLRDRPGCDERGKAPPNIVTAVLKPDDTPIASVFRPGTARNERRTPLSPALTSWSQPTTSTQAASDSHATIR